MCDYDEWEPIEDYIERTTEDDRKKEIDRLKKLNERFFNRKPLGIYVHDESKWEDL